MQETNNKSQQIAKNTIYLYLRMFLVMGVSLYTSRVILRVLGFEDFGIYNVVGSVVVFMSFLQAALRNATFRYITYELGKGDLQKLQETYSMAINCHILLAIVLFVIMEIGGVWFLNSKLNIASDRLIAANWVYQFSLLTFCLSIIRTPYESNIMAHERMDFYALTSIVEVILKLAVVYCLTITPFDKLEAYAFLLMIVTLLLNIWYKIFCKWKFVNCKYIKCWDYSILKSFASYSGWAVLVNGATITRTQCISIFFNIFLGVIANAALGIANQVVSALNTFVTNFTQAFKPQLIKSWANNDHDYFMRIIMSSSKVSYYLLLLITIPLVANIDFLLKIWLGDYPPMASNYIIAILLYYLIDALQEPLVTSVHATGNLRFHQIMIASIIVLVIPATYIILKCGYSGTYVLIANAIANLLCAFGRTVYMKRLINLDLGLYMRKVVSPVLIVTILSAPLPIYLTTLYNESWKTLLLTSAFSCVLTITCIYILGLDKTEKRILYSMPIINKLVGH